MESGCAVCVCSACSRVCAALRVAALHCAVLRCAHHAYTCRHSAQCHGDARGPQVRDVSDTCSCVPRALGVRVSVCGCGDTFSAKGD